MCGRPSIRKFTGSLLGETVTVSVKKHLDGRQGDTDTYNDLGSY